MKGASVKKSKLVGKKKVGRPKGARKVNRVAKKGIMFFVTPESKTRIKRNADASNMKLSHYLRAVAEAGITFKHSYTISTKGVK